MAFDRKQQIRVVGAAMLAAGFAVFGNHGFENRRPASLILSDLSVAGGFRVVEPRLSFQSEHAPYRPADTRERIEALMRHDPDLVVAARKLARHSQRGLASLILGEWSEAVDTLERRRTTADPIDLSAAFYMRGVATGSLSDFGKALELLRNARTPEATFNRALVLEQLFDRDAAAREWERYLAMESRPDWAAEARRHLAAARVPSTATTWRKDKVVLVAAAAEARAEKVRELAARYPLGSRQVVELELLPAWGDAVTRGDSAAAARNLAAARLIVNQRAVQAEGVLADAITEIEAITDRKDLAALAAAYRTYGEGMAALEEADHDAALKFFDRALDLAGFRSATFEAIVAPAAATAHYRRYDRAAVERVIGATRARYGQRFDRFITLGARLDWLEGLVHIARGDPSSALRSYQRALAGYERLGEAEYRAAQHVSQADSYNVVGHYERAEMHLRQALHHASSAEDPRRLLGILKVAALFMIDNAGTEPAVALLDRGVLLARSTGEPARIADLLVFRSPVLMRAGRRADARRDLDEALRVMPRIPDEPTRQRVLADAHAAEAFAYRDSDDRRVVASMTAALELYRTLEMRVFFPQLLLERGRAYLRLGNSTAAEQDFREGIAELEAQRSGMDDADLRISYLDRADRVFVELAQLLLSRGRVEEAFDFLERSRARELLDRTSGGPMQPMSARDIAARLPEGTTLVTHTAASSSLITFMVSRDGVRAVQQPADATRISALAADITEGFASPDGVPEQALRELGRLLIDAARLPARDRLVFIPDQTLRSIPFAALKTASGRYVVEEHAVTVAPSATLAAGAAGGGHSAGGSPSVLVLASSDAPAEFDLGPLPQVRDEARRVATRYPNSRVVLGSDRDAQAVLSISRAYHVLHFAGHSVVDLRAPRRSALLIGTNGKLTADEIEAEDLSHLRLVVLGGCNTSVGKTHRSEGVMSLARSFIVAGVPVVVGTVAQIDDGDAKRFLDQFHKRYAAGGDAVEALRATQLHMLRSGDARMARPASWSSFQVIHGTAKTERR